MRKFERVCVLGGAGLVGYQVCRRVLREAMAGELAVVSLFREEVLDALTRLREEFPDATILGRYGNVFSRGSLADAETETTPPYFDRGDPGRRRQLLADIYESFEDARAASAMVAFLGEFRPSAVVDCINTATAISYQDVPSTAKRIMAGLGLRGADRAESPEHLNADMEALLVSIEVPQLILHVRLLHAAMRDAETAVYLKVGTTGTGGMGLNIPYTHGEDKPSPTLMAKTAVAFAHTGLLFLASRTDGGPVVKELKPAAMIGYREVAVREVPGHVWERSGDRFEKRKATERPLFEAQRADLREPLDATPDSSKFTRRTDDAGVERSIRIACVNTGENGWFAHGEFEAITALGQMEMITPEEIAQATVLELDGRPTGRDVLAAIDATISAPTYKGGLVRQVAVDRLRLLEPDAMPSVALGDLGPPELSKYLFELYLFRAAFETLEATASGLREEGAGTSLEKTLESLPDLRDAIVSVGIPILLADGLTIRRGPEVKIPGYDPTRTSSAPLTPDEIERYARKGWVDLRPAHLVRWADRIDRLLAGRRGGSAGASDHMSYETYGRDDFRIGEVVAWVFANDADYRGFRMK